VTVTLNFLVKEPNIHIC